MGFFEDLARGKRGEEKVYELMVNRGHKVIDVSKDADYFKDDIDFIIDGRTCELKTDYVINRTGNLFLESYMTYLNGDYRKGWFWTSKAECLFYLDEAADILYIYLLNDLRNYIDDKPVPQRPLKDTNKEVWGYCLNKELVPHQTIYLGGN